MNFLFTLLVLIYFTTIPGASHITPPNHSNTTPPFPVRDAPLMCPSTLLDQSNQTPSPDHEIQPEEQCNSTPPPGQSNTTPPFLVTDAQLLFPSTLPNQSNQLTPSPAHEIQPEEQCNSTPLSPYHSPPPSQRNPTPPFPVRFPPSPDLEIQPEQHSNPSPLSRSPTHPSPPAPSQSNTIPLIPVVYQGTFQPPPPIRVPWNLQFVAMEPPQHGPLPHEFHRMDNLSLCVLNYFFASGLSHTSSWSQRPNLSTSIYIQCFLNQVAFSLLLLANAVFPQTNPVLAFIIDRFSFLLIIISAYLASMPMFPPYLAIIMFVIVVFVYIFVRYRG